MTQPDAVVKRAHRERASESIKPPPNGHDAIEFWVINGHWMARERPYIELQDDYDRTAQSLANLEAAVRREYSELQAAAAAWAKSERMAGVTDSRIQRALTELETLKNG